MSTTSTRSSERATAIENGRRGLMLILSSPSGAGKTTLTRMLLQDKSVDLTLSVSSTTRERRSSEVDGIHYHFITRDKFEQMRDDGEFLEFAEVHGNFYGSPRAPVEAVLDLGRDVPPSRFVEAAGLRWHVQILGNGPTLLLVHGTGASTHSWRVGSASSPST